MRLYRLHYTINSGESAGFGWAANKRTVARLTRAHMRGPDGEDMGDSEGHGVTVQPIDVEGKLTKDTVLILLNRYAAYPDNG